MGFSKICCGVPSSWMPLSYMKKMRVLTSRANLSLWVTKSMVMPSWANCRMTVSTSPTIEGSRADNGSSKSMTSGCMAKARAIATRCFCPPARSAGIALHFSSMPTLWRRVMASFSASACSTPFNFMGASVTFSSTVRCSNRLNVWNTIPIRCRSLLMG